MPDLAEALSAKIEAALFRSPTGRSFEPLPWAKDLADRRRELPWFARSFAVPLGRLAGLAVLALIAGFACHLKMLAGLGAGLLAALVAAQRSAWRQSGAYHLSAGASQLRVQEREIVRLSLLLHNASARPTETLLLHAHFPLSIDAERIVVVPALQPGERRSVILSYKADHGMGAFALPQVAVVVRDPLGLFPLCLSHPVDIVVEVVPEEAAMEPLAVKVAGLTMHSGFFEAKRGGDSPTFLGLRPFHSGDSIRRIDWRRSQRHGELVVREFEQLNATDATLVLDQRSIARFEYGELNSYELLRDTAIALIRSLIEQQIRVQLVTPQLVIAADKGRQHFELLVDAIKDLAPTEHRDYAAVLAANAHLVPPDSVLVPLFNSAGIDYPALTEVILAVSDRRVETIPVVIDAERFAQRIIKEAHLSAQQRAEIWLMKRVHADAGGAAAPLERLLAQLAEKTIVLGPGETIGSVYTKELRWHPRTGNT